jgi:Domain of unknown function (DUF6468)
MSPIALVLEGVLAIMLGACLFYFWRLDRKLNALRTGQDGIRAAAAELVQATTQAETAIRALKLTASEAGRDLQARINDARATADRLGLGSGRLRSSADLGVRSRL